MSRMILFPGLGADERMFDRLKAEGLVFETPRLPLPEAGETMAAYGLRVVEAAGVRPGDILGGCSFGSVVAAAAARRWPCRGLVLIGGALNGLALRGFGQGPRWLWRLFPLQLAKPLLRTGRAVDMIFGAEDPQLKELALAMIAGVSDEYLLRGARMLVAYGEQALPPCPVWAVHGGRDRVMLPPPVADCRIITGAGHGIIYTHPREVATFLQNILASPFSAEMGKAQ